MRTAFDKHQRIQSIIQFYSLCTYDKEYEDTRVPNEKVKISHDESPNIGHANVKKTGSLKYIAILLLMSDCYFSKGVIRENTVFLCCLCQTERRKLWRIMDGQMAKLTAFWSASKNANINGDITPSVLQSATFYGVLDEIREFSGHRVSGPL